MPGRRAPRPPLAGDGAGLRSLVCVTEPPAPTRGRVALLASGRAVVPRRAGGTRTPNRRFWRPGLCQLSYCPVLPHAGHVLQTEPDAPVYVGAQPRVERCANARIGLSGGPSASACA